ncbi:ergothioneine biosynthesis glutamate--cysteine ligase EgtA [Streptomyces sp. 891-h]|uniref:ergothioneine biosynthesis glutamate--cysteine ligase EgtA n=1 Tax=Streptomyces sp. 891-h TaxID=2720714 RepID=UPI001FAA5F6E|nr:ergothioneine biosynthesis glutamate--cysteine ligase EgtA [Streptomyces sp. 891-h]UNZ16487.1 ergothioneine biosynthesis glutamate--cysteine ligase EgtA [Streptomyces sp. 891-h]
MTGRRVRYASEPLSEAAALAYVHGICFKTGPPRRVGVELEWLVRPLPPADAERHGHPEPHPGTTAGAATAEAGTAQPPPHGPPPHEALPHQPRQVHQPHQPHPPPPSPPAAPDHRVRPGERVVRQAERIGASALRAAAEALRNAPLTSAISLEPGGQLEFSSQPAGSLAACVRAVSADLAAARTQLRRHGIALVGHGLDTRPPLRLLEDPRYRAMEAYFDRTGPAGRAMMCSSASVQICLDAGTAEPGPFGLGRRWLLAHLLGAVLTAAFANSPATEGPWSGWRSARQGVWASLDGYRNLAPPESGGNPRRTWARYALDAPLLCVRTPDGPWTVPGDGMTFRQWIRRSTRAGPEGHRLRPPGLDDLVYHLTTLFPPVRPRGHLELRMIDAQPGPDGWIVPLAVTTALFDDAQASESAYRVVKPLADLATLGPAPRNALWERAARDGLSDPELHAAARECFDLARRALPRLGAGRRVRAAVEEFTARYVVPGRCPADDLLDTHETAPGQQGEPW